MFRCVGLAWFLGALSAQGSAVEDLLSKDWLVRNAAALELGRAETVDAASLVRVMQTEWDGKLPSYTRYGGGRYGGRGPTEPREKVLASARAELRGGWQSSIPFDYVVDARDIVAPIHPHELACWVLLQHKSINGEVPAFEPSHTSLARAWVKLRQPNDAQLRTALEGEQGESVAAALWMSGNDGRNTLRNLLPTASQPMRRAILRIGRPQLFTEPAHIEVLVVQALEDRSTTRRKHAGRLLLDVEDRKAVAVALAAACKGKEKTVRRALGYLCIMATDAAPAVETLLANVSGSRIARARAHVALASIEIPPAQRVRAVTVLVQALAETSVLSARLLTLDAIAACGDGVNGDSRAHLQALLVDKDAESMHARLLGCLRQLGSVPKMTTAAKVEIANKDYATTATWLAVADDGMDGAKALEPLLVGPLPYVDKQILIERLIETAPYVIRKWLDHADPVLQRQALEAISPTRPIDGVDSIKVANLLGGEASVAKAAIAWLKDRPDAARFAPQVFARIIELTDSWMPTECRKFAQEVALPMPQKLDMLAAVLKRGYGWQAVRGNDPPLLRMECRRWLKDTTDPDVRMRLLGELCRAGLETAEDIRMVQEAWASGSFILLNALQEGPVLPPSIRSKIETMLSEEIGKNTRSGVAWEAREVLRAHR